MQTNKSDTPVGPQQVKEYILENFKAGQKLPSADEISEKLGSTKYAATRALTEMHSEGKIERKPRKGSHLISQLSNKTAASKVSANKTTRIAFLSNEFDSFICNELLCGIEAKCRSSKFDLSLINSDYSQKDLETNLRKIIGGEFHGAIARLGELPEDFQLLNKIAPDDFPLVILDKSDDNNTFTCVKMAQKQASYDAVTHLIKLGHEKIAFIGYSHENNFQVAEINRREYGFKCALKDAGLNVKPEYTQYARHVLPGEKPNETHLFSFGYEPTNKLLLQKERPTAIFFLNFPLMIGGLRAIHDHNLIIPNDISVICIDDEPATRFMTPSITVIAQPLREMGQLAIDILANHLKNERPAEKSVSLQGRLITRNSTARI